MSKIEVDAIVPQSGTTLTVGEAGDTVDISNATLSANLNANNLTSGTIPDARFPATLPAVDGSNLTNVQIVGGYTACDAITVTNTDTFALTAGGSPVSPESANNCIVSLNGVIQAPGTSYTISGSNIVFASALSAGSDVIDFITVLGTALNVGTVSDGTIGLAKLSATGTKDATTFLRGDNTFAQAGGGIENITTFMMTTNFTMNSGINHISTNWSTYGASLGSLVTESSGIFSFPQTGFYMIAVNFALYRIQGDSAYVGIRIDTTNNNSTYTNKTKTYTSLDSNTDFHGNMHQEYIFDVTDITNDKVKINYENENANNIRLIGNSTVEQTTVKFIRLGDT